jgi:hypothetical protein
MSSLELAAAVFAAVTVLPLVGCILLVAWQSRVEARRYAPPRRRWTRLQIVGCIVCIPSLIGLVVGYLYWLSTV